jgi:hypothetical protein
MSTFYLLLEVAALLTVIILPLGGPRKRAITPLKKPDHKLGGLAVNENGLLEEYKPKGHQKYPIRH